MSIRLRIILRIVATFAVVSSFSPVQAQETILDQLRAIGPHRLSGDAMANGDANRGAILFHQPQFQCAKCHSVGEKLSSLGPNLTQLKKPFDRFHLIDSILSPSKKIREGYETAIVVDNDGRQMIGIIEEETPTELVLRDATTAEQVRIAKDSIDEWSKSSNSIMPEGLVNQLGTRDQFLDLARYVIEVAEQGAARAKELQPPLNLVQLPPLPEYENEIDHAGMIADWDDESLKSGRIIYERVCANCHGSHEREGSLPTSPRFANSKLKSGSDPHRMYQTLTHGYGMMVAQRWMVPQQKYDVIHYIREAYFKKHNESLYANVDESYLARLPQGTTRGPEPIDIKPWITMNYGPTMNQTFEIKVNNSGDEVGGNLGRGPRSNNPWANPDTYFAPGKAPNFAYKGIAVRLDQGPGGIVRGSHWVVYDHDTMNIQAAWNGEGFIDFKCIQFDGHHGVHSRLVGEIQYENPIGPGWAQPLTSTFADPRPVGRDGRPYGPLPRGWTKYRGMYHSGQQAVLAYTVGSAEILEMPGMMDRGQGSIFTRQFSIGPASHDLIVRLCSIDIENQVAIHGGNETTKLEVLDGQRVLRIERRDEPVNVQILFGSKGVEIDLSGLPELGSLERLTKGGPPRWPERVRTKIDTVHDDVFTVDYLMLPENNPWNAQVRATGHDFFSDNQRIAVCTWDGDVWIVDGASRDQGELIWQRIATGLFQPLGLKIIDDQIFVTCRDQLVVLRDLNGDNETDFYECYNNDHQVTEHFHEFAMGLQTDEEGNFYYAKSARHAKRAVVPHHGTLLKISADGKKTDILATGFRAANGVCLNPDGSFFVTDQEGHWNPKNRINWVTEGGFYGNMYGFTDVTDSSDDAMLHPLCWITNEFDRSPAELLWVPKNAWGNLGGTLLNLSYGYGQVFVVPHEKVKGHLQGGMCALPIPRFQSGLVRGRFHPTRKDLYLSGMFSWAGSQQAPGGFYRIRYDGKPAHLPLGLSTSEKLLKLTFSDPIDRKSVVDLGNYEINAWDIKRTPNYGSDHHNEREWEIESAELSDDGRTVYLVVPKLAPTWCMSIEYSLKGANGRQFDGELHNSIYNLNEPQAAAAP